MKRGNVMVPIGLSSSHLPSIDGNRVLLVNGWMFNAITIYLNKLDILYQKALKYQHHAENYKESLALDITPVGLQLKKKAAISAISPDFNNQYNNVLKDTERKLSKLLLKEVREISNEGNEKFDKQVKSVIST